MYKYPHNELFDIIPADSTIKDHFGITIIKDQYFYKHFCIASTIFLQVNDIIEHLNDFNIATLELCLHLIISDKYHQREDKSDKYKKLVILLLFVNQLKKINPNTDLSLYFLNAKKEDMILLKNINAKL